MAGCARSADPQVFSSLISDAAVQRRGFAGLGLGVDPRDLVISIGTHAPCSSTMNQMV